MNQPHNKFVLSIWGLPFTVNPTKYVLILPGFLDESAIVLHKSRMLLCCISGAGLILVQILNTGVIIS